MDFEKTRRRECIALQEQERGSDNNCKKIKKDAAVVRGFQPSSRQEPLSPKTEFRYKQ